MSATSDAGRLKRVSASEALALMQEQGFVYIDVRAPEELAAGVPEGAFNVPYAFVTAEGTEPNRDLLAVISACFDPQDKLVIGCATGVRSLRVAQRLIEAGFQHVVDQRAGFLGAKDAFGRVTERGWQALGLPIAPEIDPARSYGALSQRKKAT